MRKSTAKRIALSGNITWGELQQTLVRAYEAGSCDTKRAIGNKALSKAASYNVMVGYAQEYPECMVVDNKHAIIWLGAMNILREFGEFWEGWRPPQKPKPVMKDPVHQEAIEPPF